MRALTVWNLVEGQMLEIYSGQNSVLQQARILAWAMG